MRLIALILFCAVLSTTCAEPEPKKYKSELKKDKQTNSSLTEDEKKFLREVEVKFGIKADGLEEDKTNEPENKSTSSQPGNTTPFPAVIAIEIVNDTTVQTKGRRTVDANLGYGYRTNNGYTYTYFGKPAHEKGKFMIYPYSQEDIPSPSGHNNQNAGHYVSSFGKQKNSYNVEIQPSRAFELVPVKEDKEPYNYPKPTTEFNSGYDNIKTVPAPALHYSHTENAQLPSQASPPATLYTTYNGEQFSGLTRQFPTVMPNYLVHPTQLLKNPEYQSVGLTNDHLRLHGSNLEQRVVPVLVLRIPSSSLKNPTAELFADLPQNYPLSRHLNNINLQELVNQYLKKMGNSFAPHVAGYQNSGAPSSAVTPVDGSYSNHGRQHYATPYVQPSYTHADYSGVQYSAVQPVMARYPSSYTRLRYPGTQNHVYYQQPIHQQKYEHQYQYIPQPAVQPHTYYVQPQYQQQSQAEEPHDLHNSVNQETETVDHDRSPDVQYAIPPQATHETALRTLEYRNPQIQSDSTYDMAKSSEYAHQKEENTATISSEYSHMTSNAAGYGTPTESTDAHHYYRLEPQVQKETASVYPSQASQTAQYHTQAELNAPQRYVYEHQVNEDSDSNSLVISENYPSKDHTIATVLPLSYKSVTAQHTGPIQTVSYVTPMPYTSKYQSPYRVMVPQTFLKNPSTEKVAYVNSHSMASYPQGGLQQEYNSEAEYTVSTQHIPPVSKQKAPSFPRNYHSYPKRMAKPENRHESNIQLSKKQNEKKKTS